MQLQTSFQIGAQNRAKPATSLAAAHARLGEAEKLRRMGNLQKSQSICESLLNEFPGYVGALQTLGVIHLGQKNYSQAMSCFLKAAMHNPKDWINLTNLASAYVGLEARELAAQTLDAARRLNPDDAEIYATMGKIYREDREYELAADCCRKALALDATHPTAALYLGDCCLHLGRSVEAAGAFKQLLERHPGAAAALYGLGQVPASVAHIDLLKAVEGARQLDGESEDEFRILLAFARGAALDRAGRHGEAWESLVDANRREFAKHEAALREHAARQEKARQTALAQPKLPREAGSQATSDDPLSLFIVGVSRSGKTSLERLVGALEGAKRGHESHLIGRAVRRASQGAGLLTLSQPSRLPAALDTEFRRFYLEELKESAPGARIFTNTHPGMIYEIGRIAAALPESRFVFVKRDANDLALRIFMKKYKSGNDYAYDLRTIFDYVAWYQQMMDILVEKLPDRSIGVAYEDMVADPSAVLARVAELCGVARPDGPLPALGDDRGCAEPYREFIRAALTQS